MKTYILNTCKGGMTLYPKDSCSTSEVIHESAEFCLDTYLERDRYGKVYSRYRFCTKEPYRFFDTMDFDIKCPRCGGMLRLCGNPIDLHEHGLYRCRRCDGERR